MKKISSWLGQIKQAWQKTGQRGRRQLIAIGATIGVMVLLLIVFLIFNLNLTPASIYTHPSSRDISELNINLPTETVSKDTDYLRYATAILAHFDPAMGTNRDSRGFYGETQTCRLAAGKDGELVCRVDTSDYLGNGSSFAAFHTSPQVIWGRYQYYVATGDTYQLQLLVDDINNLKTNVIDKTEDFMLVNKGLNCALMAELASSPYLDSQAKEEAAIICLGSHPEVHPESVWEYDQHYHVPYFIEDFGGAALPDESREIAESERETFTVAGVKEVFNNQLKAVAEGGEIAPSKYTQRVSAADRSKFLGREIKAALNYLAASGLTAASAAMREASLLDYLLLSRETFEWAMLDDAVYSELDRCLIGVNLRAYFTGEGQGALTETQMSNLLRRFPSLGAGAKAECLLAADLLLPTWREQLVSPIISYLNEMTGESAVVAGVYIESMFEEGEVGYIYGVVDNIYSAGLLSRYSAKQ